MHNSYQPGTVASEHRRCAADETPPAIVPTRQRQPGSSEPSWIIRVMSWLGSAILEGFALYGQSICPCSLDLPDDYAVPGEKAQGSAPTPSPQRQSPWLLPVRSSHDTDIDTWLASAPWHSPDNGRRWFRAVAVWPRHRAVAGKRASCNRLDVLDDLSFRGDIVDRHEASLIPEWFDPYC